MTPLLLPLIGVRLTSIPLDAGYTGWHGLVKMTPNVMFMAHRTLKVFDNGPNVRNYLSGTIDSRHETGDKCA